MTRNSAPDTSNRKASSRGVDPRPPASSATGDASDGRIAARPARVPPFGASTPCATPAGKPPSPRVRSSGMSAPPPIPMSVWQSARRATDSLTRQARRARDHGAQRPKACSVARCMLERRPMPGLLRLVPLALVALSLWLWPNDASAQTVTINQTAIDVSGEERADETRLWIGRQDCLDNDTFTIPITTTGTAGYILEIWVGAGIACNDADNRDDIGQRCFRIGTAQPQEPAQELQVRAQDVAAAVCPSDGDNVCAVSSATDVAQQFSLYVMLMTGTGFLASDSAYATWESRVDLIGPSPPPGVRAGAGEEMLVVSWTRSSQVDIAGYRLYCDPSPRGSMDAGTSSRLMAAPSGGFGGLATGGSGGLTDTGGAGGLIGTGGTFGGAAGVGTGGVPGIGGSGVTAGAGGTLGDAGSAGAVGPGPGPSGDAGSGATSSGQSCSASSVLTPGAVPTTALEGHRCGSASSGIAD